MLCDVDHFKQINDRFGHSSGDVVLQHVARLLRAAAGRRDCVYRIGGEEFAILLEKDGQAGGAIASQVLHGMATTPVLPEAPETKVSASFGLADRGAGEGFVAWFDRADKALYGAKTQGRSRALYALRGEQIMVAASWPCERGRSGTMPLAQNI